MSGSQKDPAFEVIGDDAMNVTDAPGVLGPMLDGLAHRTITPADAGEIISARTELMRGIVGRHARDVNHRLAAALRDLGCRAAAHCATVRDYSARAAIREDVERATRGGVEWIDAAGRLLDDAVSAWGQRDADAHELLTRWEVAVGANMVYVANGPGEVFFGAARRRLAREAAELFAAALRAQWNADYAVMLLPDLDEPDANVDPDARQGTYVVDVRAWPENLPYGRGVWGVLRAPGVTAYG